MTAQTDTTTYNGWKNYETWNVALWLGNDEGTYLTCAEMASDARGAEYPTVELADSLKAMVEEMVPDLGATMFADLLGAALSEVEWVEIARNILDA